MTPPTYFCNCRISDFKFGT